MKRTCNCIWINIVYSHRSVGTEKWNSFKCRHWAHWNRNWKAYSEQSIQLEKARIFYNMWPVFRNSLETSLYLLNIKAFQYPCNAMLITQYSWKMWGCMTKSDLGQWSDGHTDRPKGRSDRNKDITGSTRSFSYFCPPDWALRMPVPVHAI